MKAPLMVRLERNNERHFRIEKAFIVYAFSSTSNMNAFFGPVLYHNFGFAVSSIKRLTIKQYQPKSAGVYLSQKGLLRV